MIIKFYELPIVRARIRRVATSGIGRRGKFNRCDLLKQVC
nr:MAG TPA: hypothetical protein [Caudoviricetes sp.]